MKRIIKYSLVVFLFTGLFVQNIFGFVRKNDEIDFEYDCLDVLAIGNSNLYSGFSPQLLYKQYNYKSISFASANQTVDVSYDNLCEVLSVQKPKFVLWDVDNLFSQYNSQSFSIKKKDHYFKSKDMKHIKERPDYLNQYGFRESEMMIPSFKTRNTSSSELLNSTIQYFDLIVRTCQENDIKLLLVSIPNLDSWSYEKYIKVKELASQYHIFYLDMNKEDLAHINWLTDSRDGGIHLNNNGAYKVTKIIGECIRNQDYFIFK